MTRNLVVILFCAASVAACGGGGGQSAPAETAKPATPPESADAHVDPNEVKVEEAMLRDLRITTAAVESRTGAEDVTLLGELAVDERNYAEVGVPVPARADRIPPYPAARPSRR